MIVQGPLFISYSYKHLLANGKLLAIVFNYSVLVTTDLCCGLFSVKNIRKYFKLATATKFSPTQWIPAMNSFSYSFGTVIL